MSVISRFGNQLLILNRYKTIIVCFGGMALAFGGIPSFEFMNTMEKHFPYLDRVFLIDKNKNWYHTGIQGISENIEETLEYLRSIIVNYKNICFMGTSAGGYASILFGSLLKVNTVLAFIPQTLVNFNGMDTKYADLKDIINDETNYIIHGDLSIENPFDNHHIKHCENIELFKNVNVIRNPSLKD